MMLLILSLWLAIHDMKVVFRRSAIRTCFRRLIPQNDPPAHVAFPSFYMALDMFLGNIYRPLRFMVKLNKLFPRSITIRTLLRRSDSIMNMSAFLAFPSHHMFVLVSQLKRLKRMCRLFESVPMKRFRIFFIHDKNMILQPRAGIICHFGSEPL